MNSRTAIIVAASLLAIVAAAVFFDFYSRTEYTCLECRATLTKRQICGLPFQRISHNSYSTSFLAGTSMHQHVWRWCGTRYARSLFTQTRACGRRHPIWDLPVTVQAKYSQIVPASELDETLQAIDSPDREKAEAVVTKVFERVLDSR
jgi:hypothetical protein